MAELSFSVEGLALDTVIGECYDADESCRRPMTLGDAIVQEAAGRLARDVGYNDVRQEIRQIRREEIRAVVAREIEAALTEPVTPTNEFGEATGEPTTLRALISKAANDAVTPRGRNNYDNPRPIEQVIREEVDRALAKELAEVVKAEREKVVAAVRAKAADLIAEAVRQGIEGIGR